MKPVRCQRLHKLDNWPYASRCNNEADPTVTYGYENLCDFCAEDWKLEQELTSGL